MRETSLPIISPEISNCWIPVTFSLPEMPLIMLFYRASSSKGKRWRDDAIARRVETTRALVLFTRYLLFSYSNARIIINKIRVKEQVERCAKKYEIAIV